MELTVHIPDEIAVRLAAGGVDLPRRALEGFAIEELKAGRISEAELGHLLGLSRMQIDGFLKTHGVDSALTIEDIDRDIADLKSLGF